jgi:hypothetical protein
MTRERLASGNSRQKATICRLRRQLAAEKRITEALSKMSFSKLQDPLVMAQLKAAMKPRERQGI